MLISRISDTAHSGIDAAVMVANTAKHTVDSVRAGKKLIDDGGDGVALVVMAKKAAADAVACNTDLVQRLQAARQLYDDARVKLVGCADELSPNHNFALLAEDYTARCKVLQEVATAFSEPAECPEMSSSEKEASKILVAKDHWSKAVDNIGTVKRTGLEKLSQVKKRTESTSASYTTLAKAHCSKAFDNIGTVKRTGLEKLSQAKAATESMSAKYTTSFFSNWFKSVTALTWHLYKSLLELFQL